MLELRNCPICGAKTYIERNSPDGYYMGWSVGCPRYRINDGIHSKKMAFHELESRDEAIKKWNEYCSLNF